MIATGLVAALLMNSALYPKHCRVSLRIRFGTPTVFSHQTPIPIPQVMFLDSVYKAISYLNQLNMTLSR